MKNLLLFCLLLLVTVSNAQHKVEIELSNYDNDTLIIGNYFADRQLVADTVFASKKGKFLWEGTDTIEQGVYLLLVKPDNRFVQFLMNEDQEFKMKWDVEDPNSLKIKGNEDNELFLSYLDFLAEKRPLIDTLRTQYEKARAAGTDTKELEADIEKVNQEVAKKQDEILAKSPNSITAIFIKSSKSTDIPEFDGTEQEQQLKRYLFYKQHYFDYIDLGDPRLLRTPFLDQRINYYLEKLTPQDPDSIIIAIDYLLEKMEQAPETYRFYLSNLLNQYAKMKIVGMDAIYVHLVDKYYTSGKAPWVNEENLKKLKDQADDFRNILIGKPLPDIVTYDSLKQPIKIRELQNDYTVLIFWAPDCGHCKKSMPDVVKFADAFKDRGVQVVTVCTKGGKKVKDCKEFVREKDMLNLINTFDEYQRYRRIMAVPSTPKIFILDKDKKIILKDIPTKELENIMNEIIRRDKSIENQEDKM